MRDKRAKVAAAALALVRASNPRDEVFIINFNEKAYLDQFFTDDIATLEKALDRIQPRGETAMRDAISLALDYVNRGKQDKKVLLVVTDGNDNSSLESMEQLEREVRRSGVLIYSIGLLSEENPRDAQAAESALRKLAADSGAQAYFPKDLAEVEQITPEIAHEIRNQYTLAYSPTNQALDGTFREVKVTVTGYGTPTVRTRNGYYATTDPSIKAGATGGK
jgi:Ca-activated chloride channel homolog